MNRIEIKKGQLGIGGAILALIVIAAGGAFMTMPFFGNQKNVGIVEIFIVFFGAAFFCMGLYSLLVQSGVYIDVEQQALVRWCTAFGRSYKIEKTPLNTFDTLLLQDVKIRRENTSRTYTDLYVDRSPQASSNNIAVVISGQTETSNSRLFLGRFSSRYDAKGKAKEIENNSELVLKIEPTTAP